MDYAYEMFVTMILDGGFYSPWPAWPFSLARELVPRTLGPESSVLVYIPDRLYMREREKTERDIYPETISIGSSSPPRLQERCHDQCSIL